MEISDIDTFISYYKNLRLRTMRVVRCIPPDKIEWTYRDGKFTFGDIVRHLAVLEKHMWMPIVHGRPAKYSGCGTELADGYEEVVAYIEEAHCEAIIALEQLTPGQLLQRVVTPGGTTITAWKWLRAMCEHEIHHRGNLYTYLGMLAVETPPLYGRTSEQLAAVMNPNEASR